MLECPICQKTAVDRFKPFCSLRCANLDLGQWLKGQYRIPSERDDMPEENDIIYPQKDDDAS